MIFMGSNDIMIIPMTIVHSMLVIHLRARQQEVREMEHVESIF